MVRHISDRVGVMYLGSLVEITGSKEIFDNPAHPYTKILMSAIPIADLDAKKNDTSEDSGRGAKPDQCTKRM